MIIKSINKPVLKSDVYFNISKHGCSLFQRFEIACNQLMELNYMMIGFIIKDGIKTKYGF